MCHTLRGSSRARAAQPPRAFRSPSWVRFRSRRAPGGLYRFLVSSKSFVKVCIQPQQAPARFHRICKILRKSVFFLTSAFFLENGTPSGTIKILRKSVYFRPAGLGFRSLSKPQIASQAPGGPQAASRRAQDAPRRPQEVPRRSPGGIGRLPGGPREPEEAPRRLPGEPSEAPGRSQEAHGLRKAHSSASWSCIRGAQDAPRRPQEVARRSPGGSQEAHWPKRSLDLEAWARCVPHFARPGHRGPENVVENSYSGRAKKRFRSIQALEGPKTL